jgi:hypothetical protein
LGTTDTDHPQEYEYIFFMGKIYLWNHPVHLNIAFMGNFLSTKVACFGITTFSLKNIKSCRNQASGPLARGKSFRETVEGGPTGDTHSLCGLLMPYRTNQLHAVTYAKDKIR